MAIKTYYTVEKDGTKTEYPEAYIRVQKIQTVNAEYEHLKSVNNPEEPDVAQVVDWEKRIETSVTAFVWSDELARKNRAQVIDWFSFEFEYDLDDLDNIYQQAYKHIQKIFDNTKNV